MRRNSTRFMLILFAAILLILLCLPFFSVLTPSAQGNPTVEKQTLDALVMRRFVETQLSQLQPTLNSALLTTVPTQLAPSVFPSLTAFVQTLMAGQTLTQTVLPPRDVTATAAINLTVDALVNQTLTATAMPTPIVRLVSDKYLDDNSILSQVPCGPPCFHGITPGRTTFADALRLVQADPQFSNVQSQDRPPVAAWSAAGGDPCCQMAANQDSGLIDSVLFKLKPRITIQQVIDKYGVPDFVTYVDYSPQEVALGLVFARFGMVTWVMPGDASSTLKPSDPVVVVLYTDPKDFSKMLSTATFQGWNGYLSYHAYKDATPVVTPRFTLTPQS